MDGLEALDDLTEEVPRLLLVKAASKLAQVIKVTSIAVLHEEIEVVHGLLDVVKADHVWTTYPRQDAYLTFQILLQQRIEVRFLDDFACKPFYSRHVRISGLISFVSILRLLIVICEFTSCKDDLAILALS